VIRQGASLLRAFAGARCRSCTVVLRKAYGVRRDHDELAPARRSTSSSPGAAPRSGSWPRSRRSRSSTGASWRRIDRIGDELTLAYGEQHLSAGVAAASGFVDEVIDLVSNPAAIGEGPGVAGADLSSFAALGDSFTAGAGCPPGACWTDRLAHSLRARRPGLLYRNFARDGGHQR